MNFDFWSIRDIMSGNNALCCWCMSIYLQTDQCKKSLLMKIIRGKEFTKKKKSDPAHLMSSNVQTSNNLENIRFVIQRQNLFQNDFFNSFYIRRFTPQAISRHTIWRSLDWSVKLTVTMQCWFLYLRCDSYKRTITDFDPSSPINIRQYIYWSG